MKTYSIGRKGRKWVVYNGMTTKSGCLQTCGTKEEAIKYRDSLYEMDKIRDKFLYTNLTRSNA